MNPTRLAVLCLTGLALGCGSDPTVPVPPVPPTRPRLTPPGQPPKPTGVLPKFTVVSPANGIDFTRQDDIAGQHRLVEANGGGVALFDYDRDGRLDVFLTDGTRLPAGRPDEPRSCRLYRNLGEGRFRDVTDAAGLVAEGYFTGVAVGDFDADGFDDLYVTAFGPNRFWQNNGDGTFADRTAELGVAGDVWSTSAACADLDGDGSLDLYVANYVEKRGALHLCPAPGTPDGYLQCPPTMFRGEQDVCYLNDGQGGFRDVTEQAGFVTEDGKGLGVLAFDADRDGRTDVYVANDGVPNFLFLNRTAPGGPPTFVEEGMLKGAAVNFQGVAEASMGIAHGDYDADGRTDLLCTHFFAETNTLFRNLGQGRFEDASDRSRLGPASRQLLGFGAEFLDWDDDGWLDLFVANGHVDDFSHARTGEPYRMRPQLFRNERDGTFLEVGHWGGDYFTQTWLGRGLATGDLDEDGDLDVVVSHQLGRAVVLRNDTATGNRSVVVRLVGTGKSNRSAVGAFVEAEGLPQTTVREVVGGGSFQSASDRRVHVGLGDRDVLPKLKVTWPSGTVDEWPDVKAGHYIATEGGALLSSLKAGPAGSGTEK